MFDNKIGRFYWPTKSVDFCTTDDRFLLADFIGRQNRPTLSIVWHPPKKWASMFLCFSQQTQTDTSWSPQQHAPRSAALNIPKLSISIEDTGPQGTPVESTCTVSVALWHKLFAPTYWHFFPTL